MNRQTKILFIVLLIIILVIANFNISIAAPGDEIDPGYYEPNISDASDVEVLTQNVGIILGIIRNINVAIAVIVLMIIGVKFIIGSVEQRATYKEQMKPYIIGVLLAASGTTLVSYIYNVFNT